MRLIDADDVKKRGNCYLPDIRDTITNILQHTKTVKDAVQVVRCMECTHLKIVNKEPVYAECELGRMIFMLFDVDTREWFCADGERRSE